MAHTSVYKVALVAGLVMSLAACGGRGESSADRAERIANQNANNEVVQAQREAQENGFFSLFDDQDDPNVTIAVNRYLWQASLDVLNFMPIEQADPFSGIIQFGFGTPPGSGRAYQGTVFVQDPALDARSLVVALRTRGGPVNAETQRQIEDAILTRARQLRIRDSRL